MLAEIVTDISTDDMKMYITELVPYVFDLKLESYQVPAEGTYWGEMVELPDGLSGVLKIDFPKTSRWSPPFRAAKKCPPSSKPRKIPLRRAAGGSFYVLHRISKCRCAIFSMV